MSDVTVVCCWTNEKMYGDLVNSLKAQDIPCEIIGIDNRGNKGFTSCAAAYNSVMDDVKTKYVVYSHQDILLDDAGTMSKFAEYLGRINRDDIVGVAGVRFDRAVIITNIMQKWHSKNDEISYAGSRRVEGGMMECDTVDECFFGGHTEHFREYPFDAEICDNWHLYAVEACLRTKSSGAGKIFVCDTPLIHLSSGTLSLKFWRNFYGVCRKYADKFPFIRTTCIDSRTDLLHFWLRFLRFCCGETLRKLGLH
ncbi:MAG: hypothetical protein IJG37_10460 [Synergistaceae bacterium]|nr:hypothetical protein [Synergistaceae bacterium]MBQ7168345.1 hypothetical protein [Synergistaceae bacterium]